MSSTALVKAPKTVRRFGFWKDVRNAQERRRKKVVQALTFLWFAWERRGSSPVSVGLEPRRAYPVTKDQPLTAGTPVASHSHMFKLQLRLALECAACGALRDEDEIAERRINIQLFGVVMEKFCPSCYGELEEDEREAVHEEWRQIQADREEDDD